MAELKDHCKIYKKGLPKMTEFTVMQFKNLSIGSKECLYPNLKVQEALEVNSVSSTPLKKKGKSPRGVFSLLVTKAKLIWNVLLIIPPTKLNGVPPKWTVMVKSLMDNGEIVIRNPCLA